MKRGNKIFVVVIVLFMVGSALVYYLAFRNEKKIENDSTKPERLGNDSVTHPTHEVSTDMGAKPEKNPKDGSIKIIEDFVKANARNPNSFEFLEWSDVLREGGYWKVRCKYRGISSFNAEVTTNAWFYIRNHKVVYTKVISKI